MHRFLPLMFVLFATLSGAMPGYADDTTDEKKPEELGTITFKFENDLFQGADQQYTNGVRASYLSPEGDNFEYLQLIRDGLEIIASPNQYTRFGLALGQEIYTPEDINATEVIEGDRPYAGWLYGGASLHTVRIDKDNPVFKTLESIEFDIGVVGPWAKAQETQDFIHDLRGFDKFQGWDNQLDNELGLLLLYERKWRLFDPVNVVGGLQFDFIPYVGGSIGNVLTHANIGGSTRLGWNVPDDFGPPSLIHGGSPVDTGFDDKIGFYVYGTTEVRAVAHNIFLDGNTFNDSHSVEKETFVGDFVLGAAFHYKRFKLSYANALRSKEFKEQDDPARFGSLTASFQAFSW